MNRDDVIQMARKAGCLSAEFWPDEYSGLMRTFENFASLVASAEREECAKLVDPSIDQITYPNDYIGGKEGIELLENIAQEIRSRGKP